MVISDGDVCLQNVLDYETGLWIEYGTADNEGNYQCRVSQEETVKEGTSAYINDIHVNEDILSS